MIFNLVVLWTYINFKSENNKVFWRRKRDIDTQKWWIFLWAREEESFTLNNKNFSCEYFTKQLFRKKRIKLAKFHSLHSNIDSFSFAILNSMFVLEINRFFPPSKKKNSFVPSLDSSSIFPRSSVLPPAKKKENRTTMHRFSQRAKEVNPLNEEGRWYEWNVIVRRQISARSRPSWREFLSLCREGEEPVTLD